MNDKKTIDQVIKYLRKKKNLKGYVFIAVKKGGIETLVSADAGMCAAFILALQVKAIEMITEMREKNK